MVGFQYSQLIDSSVGSDFYAVQQYGFDFR